MGTITPCGTGPSPAYLRGRLLAACQKNRRQGITVGLGANAQDIFPSISEKVIRTGTQTRRAHNRARSIAQNSGL